MVIASASVRRDLEELGHLQQAHELQQADEPEPRMRMHSRAFQDAIRGFG